MNQILCNFLEMSLADQAEVILNVKLQPLQKQIIEGVSRARSFHYCGQTAYMEELEKDALLKEANHMIEVAKGSINKEVADLTEEERVVISYISEAPTHIEQDPQCPEKIRRVTSRPVGIIKTAEGKFIVEVGKPSS